MSFTRNNRVSLHTLILRVGQKVQNNNHLMIIKIVLPHPNLSGGRTSSVEFNSSPNFMLLAEIQMAGCKSHPRIWEED